MKWTYGSSAGIPELDAQHKQVFARFAFVKDALAKGRGWNDLHSALANLTSHFEFCAAVEEALMRIHDYPNRAHHKKEHAELLDGLHAMEKAVLTTGLTEEMIVKAFAAAMKHHLTQDWNFARYLPKVRGNAQNHGAAPRARLIRASRLSL